MADGTQSPQQRFYRGLAQRTATRGDPVASAAIQRSLLGALDGFVQSTTPTLERDALETPPPRRVAVAMAMAIFSQPHLVNTFETKGRRSEALLITNDILEMALGLSGWELDDLREEVDRRAGTVLKQATLVRWLADRFPEDQQLGLLLPGVSLKNPRTRAMGGHLYLIADGLSWPPSALYLPWLAGENSPRFQGRYADSRIKLGMARGIGVPEIEGVGLLERSVVLVPPQRLEDRLVYDQWRRSGIAGICDLGASYCGLDWITHSVEPADVRWRDWVPDEGTQDPHDSIGAFDALVKVRVHHLLQALYTDVMAQRLASEAHTPDAIDTYDLSHHLEVVLAPLLSWTKNKGSATWLAEIVKQDPARTAKLLAKLHKSWSERMKHWIAPTVEELDESPFAKWMGSVASFDATFSALMARPRDPRFEHKHVLPLFSAHFIAENPLPRGLMTLKADASSPGATLARWFWPTWQRLLDTIDQHTARTDPEFVIPEGMF